MINISSLKKGDVIRAIVEDKSMGINPGDLLTVKNTGRSRWDGMDFADCVTKDGYTVEIMKNFRDYEFKK